MGINVDVEEGGEPFALASIIMKVSMYGLIMSSRECLGFRMHGWMILGRSWKHLVEALLTFHATEKFSIWCDEGWQGDLH